MDPLQWAIDPWGKVVPIHIAWFLIWVAAIAGLLFVIVHAIYVRYFAKPRQFEPDSARVDAAKIPAHVPRHSAVARSFHWVMAASMFTLLFTAFLPKVGIQFDWVTYHWIAGAVLTVSVVFHIFHASFFLDFWSIWPDQIDLRDAMRRMRRFMGRPAPPPERFAKYPLENKLYHLSIIAAAFSVIITGLFMMARVRTIFFPRDPYLFSDMTWGMMYVLHGLAGVGLIALIMMHVYFGIRPEKRPITKSMIFGWMSREYFLEEHDPSRWVVKTPVSPRASAGARAED